MSTKEAFLFIVFAFFTLNGFSQERDSILERKVTFQATDQPVSAILQQIEKLARVSFSYNSRLIDGSQHMTAVVTDKSVEETIRFLFDDKIRCKTNGNHVILIENNTIRSGREKRRRYHPPDTTGRKSIVLVHDTVVRFIHDTVITHDTVYATRPWASNRFGFGLIGGISLANVMGISHSSFTLGGNNGGYVTIKLSDRFSLRPEILFTIKGYRYSSGGEAVSYHLSATAVQHFYYLEIPLLLGININPRLALLCGPYTGILTGAYYTKSVSVNGVLNNSGSGKNPQEFKKADLGGAIGLEYRLNNRLCLGLKYSKGFVQLSKNKQDIAITHSVGSVWLGYRIR